MFNQLPNENYIIETEDNINNTRTIVKEAINQNNTKILEEHIHERVNNKKYIQALELRNNIQEFIEAFKTTNSTQSKDRVNSFVYSYSQKYRMVSESLEFLKKKINDYRLNTAYAVHSLSTLKDRINEKPIPEFSSNNIGKWIEKEKDEYGSPEWFESQFNSLGGADVFRVIKADPKKGKDQWKEVMQRKLGMNDDNKDFSPKFEMQIGQDWQKYLLYKYSEKHPEKIIATSKTLWKGSTRETDFYRARFNGVELDRFNNVVSIIEVTTGIASDEWGDQKLGFYGLPLKHRYQILWYAKNAQVNNAVVIVVLDDRDYREYNINLRAPELEEEWQNVVQKVHEFWEELIDNRKKIQQANKNGETINLFSTRTLSKGFSKSLPKATIEKEAEKLSAYNGEPYEKIYAEIEPFLVDLRRNKVDQEIIQQEMTKLYAQHDPSTRKMPLIGIDLETNGFSSKDSRIIETAIIVSYPNGDLRTAFSSLHNIPTITKEGCGVGSTDVHRIELEMIDGKPYFEDVQEEIFELLMSGTIVAHNATFEKQYLIANLKGFAEEVDLGNIQILDTKDLTRNLILDAPNAKLQSFVEFNGIPYEGAHNATTDTYMMMKALRKFQENIYLNKTFVPQQCSEEERQKAIKLGEKLDKARI